MARKLMPKNKLIGKIGKDRLGGAAIIGTIQWERQEPGLYHSKPFRFVLEKVDEDKYTIGHWCVIDSSVVGSYHAKTATACKKLAQEVIDIEQGRKRAKKPRKKKKQKANKYDGFYRDGKRINLETGELVQDEPEKAPAEKGLFN